MSYQVVRAKVVANAKQSGDGVNSVCLLSENESNFLRPNGNEALSNIIAFSNDSTLKLFLYVCIFEAWKITF